jgi:hypothetical protein
MVRTAGADAGEGKVKARAASGDSVRVEEERDTKEK